MTRCVTWVGALALALVAWTGAARAADEQKDLPGPIDSLSDLQDTGKMIFKMVDTNNDGQISQKEAIDAGNLVAGGVFFRADANGDGVVSQEEARVAINDVLNQKPLLRYVFETTKSAKAQPGQPGQPAETANRPSRLQGIVSAIDTNNDKQVQASEVRQAVQTAVQGLFASADTNRDGQLSPAEVDAAMVGAGKAMAQAAFQQADTDNSGAISEQEFDKAIMKPAHTLFIIMDLNHDGQISPDEAQKARQAIMTQIKKLSVPEPPNSPRHLLQSGLRPSEVAPVPNFNTGEQNRPAQGTQPAAPATPPRQP
jgi:Ca2+-binding EF-hand superfamily protein